MKEYNTIISLYKRGLGVIIAGIVMLEKQTSNVGKNNNKLHKQRALVLQGGGALGAYEVGVIKTLYKQLAQENEASDRNNDNSNRPLFDIIAGTSIGAINAAVLVGNVVQMRKSDPNTPQNKIWENAIAELERFWKVGLAAEVWPLDKLELELWRPWKDKWNDKIKGLASEEAARRYYSTKLFVFGGKKAFSMKETRPDLKFLDPDSKRFILNDEQLKEKIKEFGRFPIKTSFENGQPRLLVTAVDIFEGITVVFDSYKKSDGSRKTEYHLGRKYGYNSEHNNKDSKSCVINYESGIDIDHVMASGTLPEVYDPIEISKRKFWDGGLLSNTPIKELLECHRDYWVKVEKKDQAPDLDVYIVNVHPSTIGADNMTKDYDVVKDRTNDIVYGDRTYYDQRSAAAVTDFIDFINDLKQHALSYIKQDNDKKEFENEFESLKNKKAESSSYILGEHKKYNDLIRGGFQLAKVVRIERKYDPNASNSLKTGDLTPMTIEQLIKEGEKDAESA